MNARIPALLAVACLLPACDGSDIKVTIETHSSSSEVQSSVQSSSSVVSSAVASSSSTPSHQDALKELTYHRAAWQRYSAGHYQYEFYVDCFCFGRDDFYVEWNDGAVVSRSPISDEDTPIVDNIDPSIDALFDIIEAAIMAGHLQEVAYHPQYGHPERIVVDPIPGAADTTTFYRIANFQVAFPENASSSQPNSSSSSSDYSSSSSSSAPLTLSAEEIATRLAERDAAVSEWATHQDRSYQYSLGRFGDCTLLNASCPDGYDYLYTTHAVVSNGEPVMGFEKGIAQTVGQLLDRPQNLETRIDTSDGIVTNPYYTFSYSPQGVASWRYDYRGHLNGDHGGTDLLNLEFFDELEAERQAQAFFWAADKPAGDYSFTLDVDCNCSYDGTHRVVVADNGVSAAPLSALHPTPDNLMAIDALFELLENAYSEPSAYIDVTYNQDHHFPETITFNPTLPRSTSNATYTVSALSDRVGLNEASKALSQWRKASDRYFEYRFESKEFSINIYHYLMNALGREHQIQTVLNESDTPPIASNIEEVYQTIFKYSDARDIEFQADTHGVPTEVRIHPADRAPGDYLQYHISSFHWLTSTDSSTVAGMQRLWLDEAINHYIMTINVSCFCVFTGPIDVEVQNGQIISAYSKELERELTEQERSWRIYTIDGLFKDIRATLDQDRTVEVLFNNEHHFPQLVIADREGQAVDAGYNLEITDFKALK